MNNISDRELVDALGGPLAVVERLKLDTPFALQRVCNWQVRGIPSKVALEYLSMWQEAAHIVLSHRHQKKPLPTYRVRRRADAAARLAA
jgi:hypothetical protein